MIDKEYVKWVPDFKWHKIKNEAYKIIYTEAKQKMEDVLAESESITNKSIKTIAALIAMFGFYVGLFLQNHIKIGYNSVFLIPYLLIIAGILYLIFPKEIRGRGYLPKELIPEKLDDEDDTDFQEQMLYYSAIVKLQDDSEFMNRKNTFRANVYFACLVGALLVFVACTVNIALSLTALR